MKIGIVTLNSGTNYGQRLQNYALLKVLNNMGNSSVTILTDDQFLLSKKKKLINVIKVLFKIKTWKPKLRVLNFDKFNKTKITFSKETYESIKSDKYDYIVCGSDQIWNLNYEYIQDNIGYFFADFVEPQKRIAFSASIGTDKLNNNQFQVLKDKLKYVTHISVREKSSAEILENLLGRKILCTIDPVLLLDQNQWNKLAHKPYFIKKGEKYILTYFLGAVSKELKEYINKISQESGMKVISLYGDRLNETEQNYKFHSAGPSEFIWLISHSSLILTDSFHGCAFSCIYHKPFRWFSRSDGYSMNIRIETLFSVFNLENWAVGNLNTETKNIYSCDYTDFDKRIEEERKKAIDFLNNSMLKQ